ncbi:MAG: tRNA preQ1(34) S-adenosylmethionine ribosyltransferase-isomerase QueA [Clostridiales bacterium]|nr:tRNA preQ1(34) S-adenosylmethionine ribosyltransferase-isomerase QueA [Clostridiales bacterium]
MKTRDFHYDLPAHLIAQHPAEPRDASRMLVCNTDNDRLLDSMFRAFPSYLRRGDVLVVNHTKVIPARLMGVKSDTGVPVELLLLRRQDQHRWEALVRPGRRLREGARVLFGDGKLTAVIGETTSAGGRIVRFVYNGVFEEILDALGEMPLPPYIHEQLRSKDEYQTVYARFDGSAAAPTAGLHFTGQTLEEIRARGVDVVPILLHVGLGTFRPVKAEDVSQHVMHAEYYEVTAEAAQRINQARLQGGRVVCVGTTCVRTLETVADTQGRIQAGSGMTDIFIKPGDTIKAVDMLLTNFHLPESTLLMLVSAMMGTQRTLDAYKEAVSLQYRFFSFGDCMLLGPSLIQ